MAENDNAAESSPGSKIYSLLKGLIAHKASDLHLRAGRPPMYRLNGDIIPAKMPPFKAEEVKKIAYAAMTQNQIKEFEMNSQIDFGFVAPGLARFRANVFMQKSTVAMVIRSVPFQIPQLEVLGLPAIAGDLALRSRGLLLVTGSTGSGKSTTLAAMIDHINRNSRSHIVTIEDPIEFVYEDKNSTISQRELGTDATTMKQALKAALRQDPDVIMIGEMRDYETMSIAITAAETGHLVVSTLHTNTASQSIDRIIDSFPADAKNQVRLQLASSLLGVVTQRLVRKADGKGRAVACEILIRSPSVERLILDDKIADLEEAMESSNTYYHMQSMNQALEKLVRSGVITLNEALDNSDRKEDLHLKLSGMEGTKTNGQLPQAENDVASQTANAAAVDSGLALEKLEDGGMLKGAGATKRMKKTG